jgi:hypothetical protein
VGAEGVSKEEDRIHIQWKGTDVCLDFYCDCGVDSHLDDYGAYAVKCPACGAIYELSGFAKKVDQTMYDVTVMERSEDT